MLPVRASHRAYLREWEAERAGEDDAAVDAHLGRLRRRSQQADALPRLVVTPCKNYMIGYRGHTAGPGEVIEVDWHEGERLLEAGIAAIAQDAPCLDGCGALLGLPIGAGHADLWRAFVAHQCRPARTKVTPRGA